MNRKPLIAMLASSAILASCSENKPESPRYIEGRVVNETVVEGVEELPIYPYAMTLDLGNNEFYTLDVGVRNFVGVNSKVNVGDLVRIDKAGIRSGSTNTLYGANYIEVLERAE